MAPTKRRERERERERERPYLLDLPARLLENALLRCARASGIPHLALQHGVEALDQQLLLQHLQPEDAVEEPSDVVRVVRPGRAVSQVIQGYMYDQEHR
jgi:hypothetical protein